MKEFKFFQKEIKKFNVYEEMVLGMLEYCRNNAIVHVGYSHSFVMTEITGVNHKRIVIRNVTRYEQFPLRSTIVIEYDLHLRHHNDMDETVIRSTFGIEEEEYERLMDR
jgi:hypothetical protein